ncbi:WD repeat-containing protein slp1 [Coprinopsis sp. MPI-PUGE-AT-0042]|nr:WD repeat-containing protein slp1 [Coprinopsis sp. MPI-PUGE-AT-0042]
MATKKSAMPLVNPKTPSRHRARSEVSLGSKTPLTPSLLNAMNNMAMASGPGLLPNRSGSPVKKVTRPTKKGSTSAYDTTNPFIAPPRSRPASPARRSSVVVNDKLQRQAGSGVIRRGGAESRIDVVQMDGRPELKRSKSTSAMARPAADQRDRFITSRDPHANDMAAVAASLEQMSLSTNNIDNDQNANSPGHTARLAAATGLPLNRRILGYHEPPPAASSSSLASADTALSQQREFAKPLYAQRPGATTNKTRKIPTQPERVLDAPGMMDDFYLNLLSWSVQNCVAVALDTSTYIWRADTGAVTQLGDAPEGSYVSSVDFSNDGNFLGVGLSTGEVELWDAETGQKLRTMSGHVGQVATLSWHQHLLSSGCQDGSIWHHDVRVPRHKVMELIGHVGEVCGLKWRPDGELLASGGNDNVVNIWDGRVGDVGEGARGTARWTKRNHTAAVKAVAWCPWQPSLLASGGGTNDASIHVWNSTTGARLHTLRTPSQITSIQWSPHRKEILTTHGYPTNSIMLHAYPSMERVAEIRDAHDSRVLVSCVGPAGDVVVTGAGDENLKFWRVWDLQKDAVVTKKKVVKRDAIGDMGGGKINPTKEGILSIR